MPEAVVLVLLLLFAFAYALSALSVRLVSTVPAHWWAPVRVGAVVVAALFLAIVLRFYQFAPAFLVFAWCKGGLPCGEVGNSVFNSLLGAGSGIVVLMLLPLVTLPALLIGHWMHQRRSTLRTPSAV